MSPRHARRVPTDLGRHDYADCFELRLPEPDGHSAEEWVREGLEGAGPLLRRVIRLAHQHVLLLRLAPTNDPEYVLGWRIVESTHDRVRLAAESPLVRAHVLADRRGPDRAAITMQLSYVHPTIARALWTLIGPVHRRIAPHLLERAAGRLARSTSPPPRPGRG